MIQVSYSELDTFRQCPLKHHLAYRGRWSKPKPADSALGKGTLWHRALETHYRWLQSHRKSGRRVSDNWALKEAATRVLAELVDPDTGGWVSDTHELIWWMYEGYVAYYGADPKWEILAVEHTAVVSLPIPPEVAESEEAPVEVRLKMKIDLIVREGTRLRLIDNKSCGDLPRKVELDLDDQFGLYTWSMRTLGWKVHSAIHSAARTKRNKGPQQLKDRFAREPIYRSDVELDNLAYDAYRAAVAAYRTRVPYSSPDPRTCSWKCDFRDAHLMMRKGLPPRTVLTDFGFTQEDYQPNREAEADEDA